MNRLRAIGRWLEDRTGLGRLIVPLAKHEVSPDAKWFYVFGSATVVAFTIQLVTGAALAAFYVPSTSQAYETLRFITENATLGRMLRGMHFFGASAMIALMAVHLMRVYLFASYKYPREMSWISGSVMILLVLGLGFTGQLLRWDQNAVWSVVVGVEQAGRGPFVGDLMGRAILGGPNLGADTLTRFYSLHVFVLPGLLIALLSFHLYLVVRNGISEPPEAGRPVDPATYRPWYEAMLKKRGVPFWPDAVWRDAVFALVVVAAVIALAWHFGPPRLDKPPDPTLVNAHPRPDWYFLFYFALLALMPHGLENYVIVLGPILVGVVLILLPLFAPYGERSIRRRPWAPVIVVGALTILGALTVAGKNANWSPAFDAGPLPDSVVASQDQTVQAGAQLFHQRACIYCHQVSGHGGRRGPDLTHIGNLLTADQMTIRILNGGYNMPAYGSILAPGELDALIAFLESRR
ncbi:MAG: cytochrome b N-terminal domain-containing protein [bacterium]